MDTTVLTILSIILPIISSGVGVLVWSIVTDLKSQTKQTQKELSEYKVQVAKEYVSREEIDRIITSLNHTVQQHSIIMSERFNRLESIIERMRERE